MTDILLPLNKQRNIKRSVNARSSTTNRGKIGNPHVEQYLGVQQQLCSTKNNHVCELTIDV
jgi:hypothetical protein